MSENADSTEAVLKRHWAAYCRGDVPALLADYADDAVLISPLTGVVRGRAAIGQVMQGLFEQVFPVATTRFALEQQLVSGEIAFMLWSAETDTVRTRGATDTIVVRNGRIVGQTGAGEFVPKTAT